MLIQRVVIQGFKTFAKRTEFVFDAGVTAVVGPNGSGKSNIVDAIRWCLGEQSFSLLRSRKTSDVIFSGSDKRARLGMAQVSLTLDNTGGEIPLEYAQVEISRRAYQDGENEYLVNGQRVRLSDIAELLSQTGLGKRTYAVVGQGLIDRVLSLAPEERRSLFEEAAGISGYQAKREAALRRLDATEANLTRVRDIAAELEPRLGYLKRQADRAIERAQMAADLRGLLREWYGYKWHAALAALEDFRADALIMRNTIAAREEELARLATRVEKVRREQIEVRSALNERHRAASELHTNSERVSRELAVARERQRQTLERTEEMVRDLNPLRVQQDTMTERLATTRAELEEAQGTLASHRAELAKTNAALELHRAEQRKRQNVLDEKRRNANAAQNRHAEALSRQQERRERLAGLDGSETRLASGVETSAREAETTLARVRAAEAERTQMDVRIAELATQIATLGDARNRARTALESAENARRAADRDADRLQTRLDLLQRLSNEGAGMASGVRAVMQAKRNGILGPVAALLRVPAELDKAIETALGGALQNLIAESWEDAHGAINYLKGQQRGRATFLPLDRLNFGSPIKAPRMDGVLGNAAELVECDARITRARDQLLNRVWIVQDLPTARRALDTLRDAPRPTVVTLDGEIVRPGGAVTGGSDGSREDNSVLQRERELRELPAQVSAAASAAKSAATECQRLNTEDAALRAQREEAQRNHADLTRQERTQQSALAELRRAADRAEQQREFAQQQAKQIASERAHLLAQLEEGETQVTRLMSERETSAQELTEAESTVESDGGEELLRTLADQRALEAHADGLRASRASLVTQQERTLADLAAQIAAKENRIAALTQENEELAGRLGGLHEEERSLRAEISALQTEIAPLETQVAALEAEQGSAESEERAVQQTQRRDEAAWSHLQVALQRSEDTVSQLQSEILRDLGLVTLEQSDDIALQQPLPFEAFVEALPVRDALPEGMDEEVTGMRARLGRLTNVNPEAPREYEEASSRFIHLTTQADDLSAAAADLHKIVKNLDELMQSELARTFAAVAVEFQHEFRKLFNGGTAELVLTDPDNIASSGIDIIARPPGKRPQALALLSGGERSLAACALIFAILRVSPTPFCVLDEVDAALDEANVDRFRLAVSDLSALMQFIIVTHNRRTLEGANTIYGITMGNDGVSRVIGLRLEGDAIVHNKNGNGASPQEDAPSQAEVEEIVAI